MKKIILIILLTSNLYSENNDLKFEKANKFVTEKKYTDAIYEYQEILKSGVESAELHYNLGFSYFKINKLGKAILHFEKAKKINPSDEDLIFNLKYAELRKIDKIDEIPEFFLKLWLSKIYNFINSNYVLILIYLFLVIGISIILIMFFNQEIFRRSIFLIGVVFVISSIFLILIYETQRNDSEKNKIGIITTSTAMIKLTPTIDSEDAFILHEGTKISLIEVINNWSKIKIGDGKIGWIENINFGEI